MAFREVGVVEIKEILRLRLQGRGQRKIAELTLVDRKTVRRYLEAAEKAEFRAEGGEAQITDELIGKLVDAVRPVRPQGHGESWDLLLAHREFLKQQLDRDLRLTTVRKVLRRKKGVEVTYPTLRRFCVHVIGWGRKRLTVRVADWKPGAELQVDFGRMGLVSHPCGRRRMLWALIFTSVYSRHMFVFLTHSQSLPSVIEGFECAWAFFGVRRGDPRQHEGHRRARRCARPSPQRGLPGIRKLVGDRTVRWVLLHMLEETARHAGHADITRELLDGSVGS